MVGFGQQVAGQLFQREPVERLVLVERLDDVIAEGIDADRLVAVIADAVRITHQVEPPHGHPLAEFRRAQQPVDDIFVRLLARIGQKRVHLRRRRRQTGQIEAKPSQQCHPIRLGRRSKSMIIESLQDEAVDIVLRDVPRLQCRRMGQRDRQKGPVPFPFRPLLDPAAEECPIGIGQDFSELSGRHPIVVLGADPPPKFAFVRLARHNDAGVPGLAEQSLFCVQPQVGFPLVFVRPVAGVTVVAQDRADIAIEFDRLGKFERRTGGENGSRHPTLETQGKRRRRRDQYWPHSHQLLAKRKRHGSEPEGGNTRRVGQCSQTDGKYRRFPSYPKRWPRPSRWPKPTILIWVPAVGQPVSLNTDVARKASGRSKNRSKIE